MMYYMYVLKDVLHILHVFIVCTRFMLNVNIAMRCGKLDAFHTQ